MTTTPKNTIYLATNNAHKAGEFTDLAGGRLTFLPARTLKEGISWVEDGRSFIDNARIKARTVRQYTDDPVLADDSGLMVEALGGEPGVYSSRYCGREGDDLGNMNLLLERLSALPSQTLHAKFVCCLWFIAKDGTEHTFTGECPGRIILTPRGAKGFGYDPVFLPEGEVRTLAELDMDEKNRISHRFRAFQQWHTWYQGTC
jgi:XTP/dITP diphosphohydrolase